ncbi:MAG: hypothetical protein KDD43_05110, partial [Bdellovibrionales bacterium]|nr:hypothetical protein [Bdellovibrionales bacterium]
AAGIIDELMVHAPEAEIVALFKEQGDMISVSLRSTTDQANVMEIASAFGGGGHVRAAGAKITGKSLAQVSNEVLAVLQAKQAARLGISGSSRSLEKEPEITQVLEGYTHPKTPPHPSLEERAMASAPVAEPVVEKPLTPSPVQPEPVVVQAAETLSPVEPAVLTPNPFTEGETTPAQQVTDQSRTKAAIEAEQAEDMSAEEGFSPSSEALRQTPQRPQEKRFTDELPDFLKEDTPVKPAEDMTPQPPKSETPPAPAIPNPMSGEQPPQQQKLEPAPPVAPASMPAPEVNNEDDGVSVKVAPATQPMPTPEIPEDSAEPTVKTVSPPVAPQDTQDISDALSGFGGGPTPPTTPDADAKPEPPKDPFALGDDGLTDIERALGGL